MIGAVDPEATRQKGALRSKDTSNATTTEEGKIMRSTEASTKEASTLPPDQPTFPESTVTHPPGASIDQETRTNTSKKHTGMAAPYTESKGLDLIK